MFSLGFALCHFAIELLIILLESYALQTKMISYIGECLNGLLGWVPFLDKLKQTKVKKTIKKKEVKNQDYEKLKDSET